MCMINEMNARIKDLEQMIREKDIALMGLQAKIQGLQSRLSVTEREKAQLWDQARTLHLVAHLLSTSPGEDVIKAVPEAVRLMVEERDKLLDGYPEGMTPADVLKLKEANAGLAAEVEDLSAKEVDYCNHIAEVDKKVDQLQGKLDNITQHATHAARCQLAQDLAAEWDSDQLVTVEQVVDLLATEKEADDAA